jgi:hypothetical protein
MEGRGSREHGQPHRRGDFHKQKRYDSDSEYSLLQLQLHCSQPRSSFYSTHTLQNESNCDSALLSSRANYGVWFSLFSNQIGERVSGGGGCMTPFIFFIFIFYK